MPEFQADNSRQALKPLIGDPIKANNRPPRIKGSRWEDAKALVCPDKLGAGAVVAAFKAHRKSVQHTSNSKYYVLRRDKWESHEGTVALLFFMYHCALSANVVSSSP